MAEKQSLEVSVEFSPVGDGVGFALNNETGKRIADWLSDRQRTLNTMSHTKIRVVMVQILELKLAAEHVNGGEVGDEHI